MDTMNNILSVSYLSTVMPDTYALRVDHCFIVEINSSRSQDILEVNHVSYESPTGVWNYNLKMLDREIMCQLCVIVEFNRSPAKYINMNEGNPHLYRWGNSYIVFVTHAYKRVTI